LNDKNKVITFYGTLQEIQDQYNKWVDEHDNINIEESVYLPVRETGQIKKFKTTSFEETENFTQDTFYAKVVHYIETDEMHIKRVTKGTGIGVS
jgi:hypothetical protein